MLRPLFRRGTIKRSSRVKSQYFGQRKFAFTPLTQTLTTTDDNTELRISIPAPILLVFTTQALHQHTTGSAPKKERLTSLARALVDTPFLDLPIPFPPRNSPPYRTSNEQRGIVSTRPSKRTARIPPSCDSDRSRTCFFSEEIAHGRSATSFSSEGYGSREWG